MGLFVVEYHLIYSEVLSENGFKYHSDIRHWRKQLSKLKFVLEDKSEVISECLPMPLLLLS